MRVEIPRDYSGNSRGFAIVLMETLEDAQKACQSLNGYEWMGRPLEIRADRTFPGNAGGPPSRPGKRFVGNSEDAGQYTHLSI